MRRFGYRSVFVKLLIAFGLAGLAVSMLFAAAGRRIWRPSPAVHEALAANVDRFASDLVREIGSPPDQASLEKVARERKFAIRVDGPEGTLVSEPGLPDPKTLRTWKPRPLHSLEVSRNFDRLSAVVRRDGRTYLFSIERDPVPFLRWTWWLGWIVASLAVLAFAFNRVHRIFSPLKDLTEAAETIASGRLDVRLPEGRGDEFGHLQGAFNRMAAKIEAMIRGREQLLRDVSHELRSPLARVKVAAALLPDSRVRESVEEDVRELESLVDLLLERGRLEAGAPLSETRFDLVELLEELMARYADRKPGFRWRAGARPAPLLISADRDRLRTALRNLMENAVKYAADAPAPAEISVEDGPSVVVRDFGPGIPASDAERIFDPFQRGDSARTRGPQGSGGFGLGLDLARRIARAHGGDLVLLPTPPTGKGAAFRLGLVAGGR